MTESPPPRGPADPVAGSAADPATGPAADRASDPPAHPTADPRLDESAWRVFGRRFPRRWSLYARIIAGVLLLLSLGWWFTRDVTYVSNVKVAGLDAVEEPYREPLRTFASDFAALVNELADQGYGWQSGALPTLRADGALTAAEDVRHVAVGSLEVKKGGAGLGEGDTAIRLAEFMAARGWDLDSDAAAPTLEGASRVLGPLKGEIKLEPRPEGREALLIEIARS